MNRTITRLNLELRSTKDALEREREKVRTRENRIEGIKVGEEKAVKDLTSQAEKTKLLKEKLLQKEKDLGALNEKYKKLESRAVELRDELDAIKKENAQVLAMRDDLTRTKNENELLKKLKEEDDAVSNFFLLVFVTIVADMNLFSKSRNLWIATANLPVMAMRSKRSKCNTSS
jgi:chromosome segregation ATPase